MKKGVLMFVEEHMERLFQGVKFHRYIDIFLESRCMSWFCRALFGHGEGMGWYFRARSRTGNSERP